MEIVNDNINEPILEIASIAINLIPDQIMRELSLTDDELEYVYARIGEIQFEIAHELEGFNNEEEK